MKQKTPIPPFSVLWAILLLFLPSTLRAASSGFDHKGDSSHYGIDFWHEAQGLLSNRIRDIVQTRDGYLWLATDGGLVRFDGADFTTFGVRTGSLKYDEVWALKEDKEGGLWVGTFGGGLTLLKNGRFTTFTTADGLPDDAIRLIDIDPSGNLWIATSHGACRYSQGRFTSFTSKDGLSHDFVIGICAGSPQGVFAVAGDKLHRFVDGKFVVENGLIQEKDGRIWSLSSGRDGSLWIYFEGGLAKKFKDGRLTTYPFEDKLATRTGRIYEDPQGTVWVGTRDGLRRLRNGKFETFPSTEARTSLGMVFTMCADREGSLWLGLEVNGLARLRRTQFNTLPGEGEWSNNSVSSVFQDSKGNIWIGTSLGFARYSGEDITLYTELDGAPIPPVTSIAEDKDGNLWIGAGGQLLKMKDGRLSKDASWKRAFEIKTIYRDPKGRMWVAPDGDGLFRYEDGRVTVYRTQDGLPSNQVRGILYDRHGVLWVTTFGGGVSRFADGKFTTYTVRDGLGSNRVVAVHEDESGLLWFATRGGLSRFKDGRFFNYTIQDGLLVNQISGILEDAKGNFWFSCAQGIFRVSKAELNDFAEGKIKKITSSAYGVRDGMRSMAFAAGYYPNACKTRDGRLLFASLKGLVTIYPDSLFTNALVPAVHIEKVLFNKRLEHTGSSTGPHVDIPPGEGEVEIRYSALSFLAPEKVQFKYRLEGFDKEWVEAGTRRFAFYANLPAGEYRFQVIACNNDGVWNETGDSFSFHLQPHFYQTRWFLLLCLLALIVLAAIAYQLRVRQLKAHERELQKKVDEALAKVKILSGMLPICSNCKKVRDDKGYWSQIESYIREHSDTKITHGICPDCLKSLYPQFAAEVLQSEEALKHY
jgi:ligand-binding sensor domain-containing protein